MYQDYLEKFPNGTFAQLARINIQKLSKAQPQPQPKSLPQAKTKSPPKAQAPPEKTPEKTSTSKLQASVAAQPAPPKPEISSKPAAAIQDGRYKMAVLPWRLRGSSYRLEPVFVNGFLDFVRGQKNAVVAKYSYYEIRAKAEPAVKKLSRDYFNEDLINQLWPGDKPNIDLICKIGKDLGVDVVFTSDLYTKPAYNYQGRFNVFFVDIHTRRLYSGDIASRDVEADGDKKFNTITQKVFKQYAQNASRPATALQTDVDSDEKYVQASLTPVGASSKIASDDTRITLAIFPWKLTGSAPRWNPLALEALTDVIDRCQNQIVPLYTYYAVKTHTRPEVLKKDFFTKDVVSKLWSSSDDGPNVSYVCDLGKHLEIDLIFMCNIDARTFDPDPGTYKIYVIDVNSGKLYAGRAAVNDIETRGRAQFTNLAQRLFAESTQNR
jgi:hypothetical protein